VLTSLLIVILARLLKLWEPFTSQSSTDSWTALVANAWLVCCN